MNDATTISSVFEQAAGFSGDHLSLAVRSITFLLVVLWGAGILIGIQSHMTKNSEAFSDGVAKMLFVGIFALTMLTLCYSG